jgi:tRNA (mo5U34)-methyltransferase
MNEQEIIERASKIAWWHKLALTPNYTTPGWLWPAQILALSDCMEHVKDKRVLDVGAWDGGLSFLAEKRGASEVTAMDTWDWGFDWKLHGEWRASVGGHLGLPGGLAPRKAGFELAREALGSKVKDVQMNIIDATPEVVGTFDVVLFCGVLYHLKHPMLALESLRPLCKDLLVIETHIGMPPDDRPFTAFYPGAELNNDPSNWWGPNVACVKAWLAATGFKRVYYLGGEGRGVFHAYAS